MSHEIDTHPLCKCTRKLLLLLLVVVVADDGDIGNWFPWAGWLATAFFSVELDGFAHLRWEILCGIIGIEVD